MAILTKQQTQPIEAIVGHICAEKSGNFGPYHATVFESSELPDGRIWKNLKPTEAAMLQKGMKVQLTQTQRNGRSTYDVVLDDSPVSDRPAPAPTAKQSMEALSPELKREMAAYSREMISLYSFLWKQSKEALEAQGCTDDETIRTSTSSVFIAVQRKFNLA